MLKLNIDKAAYDALPKDVKAEYKANGDAGFILDLDGYEDPVKLKSAKDHEKEQRKNAEKAARDLQAQLDALTTERDDLLKGAIPKADVEKLETSYKTKLAKREAELTAEIGAMSSSLQTLLVDGVARTIASEISTAPALILPHIKGRLRAEKGADGNYITKVVDADGKPSALSVDDLKKEISLTKDFAPIITGSKASGGGAGGSGGSGGAGSGKQHVADLSKLSPKELAAHVAAKPGALRTSPASA